MQRDGAVLNMVLRIFLRVIAQSLQTHSPGAAQVDKAALHIGAIAFIHRFGSSLNARVHFHVCVVDGVFEAVALEGEADAQVQASSQGVVLYPATGIDQAAVAQVQATVQKRILRAFVARGLPGVMMGVWSYLRQFMYTKFIDVLRSPLPVRQQGVESRHRTTCPVQSAMHWLSSTATGHRTGGLQSKTQRA